MTTNNSKPSEGHSESPKQGPLSKTELREQIEYFFVNAFKLGMLDALGGENRPDPLPALKSLQQCTINSITTYTNSLLDEAIGGKQLVKHMDFQDEAVPVAALGALRGRLG